MLEIAILVSYYYMAVKARRNWSSNNEGTNHPIEAKSSTMKIL